MRIRQILFAGILCASAIATAQNSITFAPKFTKGMVLRYHMSMNMAKQMAMQMTITERVAKVYPNGDVDVVVSTTDGMMALGGGKPQPMPKTPVQNIKMNKYGQPVGEASKTMGALGFDPTSMGSMMPRRPLHAGEVVPIHTKGKGGSSVEGTLKVVSISGGVARLQVRSTVTMGARGSMKMDMTSYVGTADSQMRKMEGTMSGFMGQPNAVAHISMARF